MTRWDRDLDEDHRILLKAQRAADVESGLPACRVCGCTENAPCDPPPLYMALAKMRTALGEPKYASMRLDLSDERRWYAEVQEYLRHWVEAHKGGAEDTWTPTLIAAQEQGEGRAP